ncbi:hypothetical protein BaOVIS_026280 [Babesia ovis]|uniref:Uncharacterized protein n=1 Tax=Babesia ovis TaxID=5869 RepID=A0A9W5TEW5_BABOV|nr:hypothetical protein BaOVIS_026280 [Babesia ovis]
MDGITEGMLHQFATILYSFQSFSEEQGVEGCDIGHVDSKFIIPQAISSNVRNVLWEEDARGIDLATQFYNPDAADSQQATSAEATVIPETVSDSDTASDNDEVDLSSEIETVQDLELDTENGVESNFSNFTYWTVETGPRVSYTTKPVYAKGRAEAVTLLEEAEAFVSLAMWGGQEAENLQNVPRHLLVQAAQVTSRAFFDPDYRNYLFTAYSS